MRRLSKPSQDVLKQCTPLRDEGSDFTRPVAIICRTSSRSATPLHYNLPTCGHLTHAVMEHNSYHSQDARRCSLERSNLASYDS
ncbi:hypothetical protein E2C01_015091 [Portunus trituberculatus]|uniref:Uncharacterized protein n=1 Tax=Portunus trituberculatus TaxID=210409 RepID=A0A5B7DLM9_PORTR|nr:hypothetical protein [Portunus trituberculatus]